MLTKSRSRYLNHAIILSGNRIEIKDTILFRCFIDDISTIFRGSYRAGEINKHLILQALRYRYCIGNVFHEIKTDKPWNICPNHTKNMFLKAYCHFRKYRHKIRFQCQQAAQEKKSFLVFKNNKYFPVPTETIAFFYIKYDNSVLAVF